ncbi:CPBP family intramembrane glutamic endopeptidase [Streptococcus pseudoporcinus]|uniref:CAAX amino terminal protease family protein n=1 Tax=Streptococcus pseudoporcinus LQ 940-04 TaxID=875093 RepID=G5K9M0_9STRE|nr:type II CAAX endopeptidase family protein [Streptococcus pseudoporcinus]EFR43539.1 CAAX amino terminal protease family protein [Streptococcus pseudoporcinus SPIN 20026]EHI64754.1 CAAX amino terminal protease family protein [Streptococcus pseudoporcinus LQ 940-04]VEF93689.1 CAAX amino terminal protease family protein [Streptococcus pseudoporcinus]
MINKRMLQLQTSRYQKLPAWLISLLACGMVEVFFILGSLLGGIFLGMGIILTVLLKGGSDIIAEIGALSKNPLVELGIFPFVSLVLFAWVKWYEKRPLSSLGFFKHRALKELAKGWFLGLLLFSLTLTLSFLLGGLELQSVDFSFKSLGFILLILPLWLLQGGTEELLTRGWLLPILAKRTNLVIAIIVSNSLFGMMHLGNEHVNFLSVLSIILVGIFLSLYMLKTDNLWGVAGIHGAWNFTQGNIFGVSVSGTAAGPSLLHFTQKAGSPDWISGGAFGTEGSLLTSLVLLCATSYLAWQLLKEKRVLSRIN